MYYEKNEEAFSYTFNATGTQYSDELSVGKYIELLGAVKAVYANPLTALVDVTLEIYHRGIDTWIAHATTFTQISANTTEAKAFTSFGIRVRFKAVASGVFGAGEEVALTISINGKG